MSHYTFLKLRAEPIRVQEWWALSKNPSSGAMKILEANPEKIMYEYLSRNPSAISLLSANRDIINWFMLSSNVSPDTPALLATKRTYINWKAMSDNRSPQAIAFLSLPENIVNVEWWILSQNTSPAAIELLIANPDKICWSHAFENRGVSLFAIIEAAIRAPGYNRDNWAQMFDRYDNNGLTLYDAGWLVVSKDPRPEAIALLHAYPEMINYNYLSLNPAPEALKLLMASPDKINWNWFSTNSHPDAVALLLANIDKINWYLLAKNTNPDAVALLSAEIVRRGPLEWYGIWKSLAESSSPEAIAILHTMRERIGGSMDIELSRNESPAAAAFLTEHPEYINWEILSANKSPAAAAILASQPQKIYWSILSRNEGVDATALFARNVETGEHIPYDNQWVRFEHPAIFEEKYDYAAIRFAMDVHREALARAVFHPRRLERYLEAGGDPDDF